MYPPLTLTLCLLPFRSQNYPLGLPHFKLLLYLVLEGLIKPYTFQSKHVETVVY